MSARGGDGQRAGAYSIHGCPDASSPSHWGSFGTLDRREGGQAQDLPESWHSHAQGTRSGALGKFRDECCQPCASRSGGGRGSVAGRWSPGSTRQRAPGGLVTEQSANSLSAPRGQLMPCATERVEWRSVLAMI